MFRAMFRTRSHHSSFAHLGSLALLLSASACTVQVPDGSAPSSSPSSADEGGAGGSSTSPSGCVRNRDVTANETWGPAACPNGYVIEKPIGVVGAGVELHIEPGTLIKLDNASLSIGGSASLVAEGTADKKIRFTGWQPASGSWGGIVVNSNSVKNKIAYAVVEYAGSDPALEGAIHLGQDYEQPARLELSDVEIKDSARYGLWLRSDAKLGRFERVTIEGNALGVAHVEAPSVAQLRGTDNVFENNGPDNVVLLETDILLPIAEDAIWPSVAPAKYRVVGQHGQGGDLVRVARHLTIEPGAVFEMAGGSGFLVESGTSGLKAIGTPDKKIVFRGMSESSWLGITFGESTWTENRLENVEIRNANAAPEWAYYGTGDATYRKGGILLGYNYSTPVHLTVKDVLMAGPNAAPANITRKQQAVLALEGTNAGTGAGGALDIEVIPF